MNLYVDASALVKRYIYERGTVEFNEVVLAADQVATCLVTRAELSATLAKLARMEVISQSIAARQLALFRQEWTDFVGLHVFDLIVARADMLAWDYGLRGYDAVHLASALSWQDALGKRIVLATFDKALWNAAKQVGLDSYPADLAPYVRR